MKYSPLNCIDSLRDIIQAVDLDIQVAHLTSDKESTAFYKRHSNLGTNLVTGMLFVYDKIELYEIESTEAIGRINKYSNTIKVFAFPMSNYKVYCNEYLAQILSGKTVYPLQETCTSKNILVVSIPSPL